MQKKKFISVSLFILAIFVVLFIPGEVAHAATISPVISFPAPNTINVGPDSLFVHQYFYFGYTVELCDGTWVSDPPEWRLRERTYADAIKQYRVSLYESIHWPFLILTGETGFCDAPPGPEPEVPSTPRFKANCNKFNIDSPVKQGMWVEFSFKGSFHIDSAYIFFPKLNLTLYPSLASYDWATKTWTGYLNTSYLPTGKHHGRLFVSYEGVSGKSCSTGSFKVVE